MIKQISRNVHTFSKELKSKEEFHTLQISDVHWDSHKCDRELLTKHLKEAEKKGALVFINGDLFDVMGIKTDPRSTYSDIRPEFQVTNYLDVVINGCAEYLSQFKVTYFIGRGNHETNIHKRQGTDPTDRVVQLLKFMGVDAYQGGYSGWMIYKLKVSGTRGSFKQHYHHGYGGNAPRSKGVLKVDLNMMSNPDADIITRGHDHNKWHVPVNVKRLSNKYVLEPKTVHNLQTGSYKMLGDGFGGWATEKGFNEPRLGGWWVSFKGHRKTNTVDWTVNVIEAT